MHLNSIFVYKTLTFQMKSYILQENLLDSDLILVDSSSSFSIERLNKTQDMQLFRLVNKMSHVTI